MDRLDALALRPRHGRDVLSELAKLRQRVAFIRRTLTPHREVYAALSRPDFQAIAASESAAHYGLLNDRLERAIEAVGNARDLLVGSFDMFRVCIKIKCGRLKPLQQRHKVHLRGLDVL